MDKEFLSLRIIIQKLSFQCTVGKRPAVESKIKTKAVDNSMGYEHFKCMIFVKISRS